MQQAIQAFSEFESVSENHEEEVEEEVYKWKNLDEFSVILVTVTQLHLVMLVAPYITFLNCKRLSHYCPCCDWVAMYSALFHFSGF